MIQNPVSQITVSILVQNISGYLHYILKMYRILHMIFTKEDCLTGGPIRHYGSFDVTYKYRDTLQKPLG